MFQFYTFTQNDKAFLTFNKRYTFPSRSKEYIPYQPAFNVRGKMPYLYTPEIQQLRFELNNVLGSMKDVKASHNGMLEEFTISLRR